MLYRIHEVAKMTGLSVNGIRYYERQGVVKPVRKEAGGYRLYGIEEISAINRAINYRQMGFSLPGSARLANIRSFSGILRELDGRAEELEAELREKEELLRTVRARTALIEEVRGRGEACTVEESPDLLWAPTYRWEGEQLVPISDEALAFFVTLGPAAAPSVRIAPEDLSGQAEELPSVVGYCLEAGAAPHLAEDPHFLRLPPRRCIYTAVRFLPSRPLPRACAAHAVRYAREQGLVLSGHAFTRRVIAVQPGAEHQAEIYSQAWFPVDSAEK